MKARPAGRDLSANRSRAGPSIQALAGSECTLNKSPDTQPWQEKLDTAVSANDVPGAVLGVLNAGQYSTWASGLLGVDTRVTTSTDSLFKIGSITKVWTAALIMQLVDEGSVDLETPVVDVLPEFAVANRAATADVTIRHLLTHTSGIDGDIYIETGNGDDCIERYVAELRTVGQLHAVGSTLSYCNAGFNVAGRIVEKVTGLTWNDALQQRLVGPLGLRGTVTLAEEAILHRTAVGHFQGADGRPRQTTRWMVPRSSGPSAAIAAPMHDLLTFAGMFIDNGRARNGNRILSPEAILAMTDTRTPVPAIGMGVDSWGLGWFRSLWNGELVLGHDGASSGQRAYLRIFPGRGVAVALMANGEGGGALAKGIFNDIITETTGLRPPDRLSIAAAPPPVRFEDYTGKYRRQSELTEVHLEDGQLRMRIQWTGPLLDGEDAETDLTESYDLRWAADDVFLACPSGADSGEPVTFYTLPDGTRYLHFRMRANPRSAA